jgi:signal transduction histidine kinase
MQTMLVLCVVSITLLVAAGLLLYLLYRQKAAIHTVESQNQSLVSKCRRLEEINHAKDKFFTIVSHDLKTPLNSLQSLLMLLNVEAENLTREEVAELTRKLEISLANSIDLANNLIRWARAQMQIESGLPVGIDLTRMVEDVIQLYATNISRKEIRIVQNIPAGVCLFADRDQMEFVIRNLLCNSIKFSHWKGTVKFSAFADGSGRVEIMVQDSGIGLPENLQGDLFRLGARPSRRGTEGEEGTGIGLVLCKEFVEKNGGQIQVESLPDQGATIRITMQAFGSGKSTLIPDGNEFNLTQVAL